MKIAITETARMKIEEKSSGKEGFLKLKYDTDGCGCVVSGVAALWLVDQLDEDDRAVETNGIPIYIEKSKEVFFDEDLKIDYLQSANCFQLKSPSQYLNPRMSFFNKIN